MIEYHKEAHFNLKEVAKMLNTSSASIYINWVWRKRVPALKINNKWHISESNLSKLFTTN
jgi:diketogulonate reductase-like aldo/keto reductase